MTPKRIDRGEIRDLGTRYFQEGLDEEKQMLAGSKTLGELSFASYVTKLLAFVLS